MANRNQQQFVGGAGSNVSYLGGSAATGGALGQARNMYSQGKQGFFSANMVKPSAVQLGQMQRQSLGQVYNADGTWSTPGTGFRQHEWRHNNPSGNNQLFTGTRFKGQGNSMWVGNAVQGSGANAHSYKSNIPSSYGITFDQWNRQNKPAITTGTQNQILSTYNDTQHKGGERPGDKNGIAVGVSTTKPKPPNTGTNTPEIDTLRDTLVNIAAGGTQTTPAPPAKVTGTTTVPQGYRPPTKTPVKGLEGSGMFKNITPPPPKGMSKVTGNEAFGSWWAKHPYIWKKTGDQIRKAFTSYLKSIA